MTTWWELAELSVNSKPSAAANTISAAELDSERRPRTLDNLRRRNAKRISTISSNGGHKCSGSADPWSKITSRTNRTRARTDGGQCARATPERNTLGGGETNRRFETTSTADEALRFCRPVE